MMNVDALKSRDRWPYVIWGGYALVVILAVIVFLGRSSLAPDPGTPFQIGPEIKSSIDNPTVSRGSVGHDGVDHLSALAAPLSLIWMYPLNVGVIGGGLAEAAVDASGIYVGADTGWLRALEHDAQPRWAYVDGNATSGISGAPALDTNKVYFGTSAGNLSALDKKTGQVSWMQRFDGQISGAPLLFDESLYAVVSTGRGSSYVVRVKRSDGTTDWRSDPIQANSASGPAVDRTSGLIFVGAADRRVHAFNLKTGQQVWERELDASVDATPSLIAGTLFVASNGEFAYSIKATNGEVIWKTLILGGSRANMTWEPINNIVLVGTNRGLLYALDRHTGKTRWIDKTGTIFSGMAGAIAVSQAKKDQSSRLIWVTCADLVVCALDPRTGRIVDQLKTLGPVASSPVVFQESLYLVESTGALRKYSSHR